MQHVAKVEPNVLELSPSSSARPLGRIRRTKDHHPWWPCHKLTSDGVHDAPSLGIICCLFFCMAGNTLSAFDISQAMK